MLNCTVSLTCCSHIPNMQHRAACVNTCDTPGASKEHSHTSFVRLFFSLLYEVTRDGSGEHARKDSPSFQSTAIDSAALAFNGTAFHTSLAALDSKSSITPGIGCMGQLPSKGTRSSKWLLAPCRSRCRNGNQNTDAVG